jgi:hypothetical protein
MNWLKTIAPLVGTALGTPLGGIAATIVAEKLGLQDSTVDSVSELLNSNKLTSEHLTKLKIAEIELQKFLQQNGIDIHKLHNENTADARKMQALTKSRVPGFLAVVIVTGYFAILAGMLGGVLKISDQQSLLLLLGSLSAGFGVILNYYYGSSKMSDDRSIIRLRGRNETQ